jgi:hypothetical protein
MSIANTRSRRCAHDIARCRSLTDTSPRAAEAAVRVSGTIRVTFAEGHAQGQFSAMPRA